VARTPLTFRRLSGLDRSGGPPPETVAGAPLNPWTIPNAIGFVRFALLPVFLVLAFSDGDGRSGSAALVFALIAWGDQLDGVAARVTGQYSRLGALMDPVIDRLLVVSGIVVCYHFHLLPRWALVALFAREIVMLGLANLALRRGVDLAINWWGRWGVWPAMGAPFFAIASAHTVALVMLYVGLFLTWTATAFYMRDGWRATHGTLLDQPST
jgi:cardiolipin synthase